MGNENRFEEVSVTLKVGGVGIVADTEAGDAVLRTLRRVKEAQAALKAAKEEANQLLWSLDPTMSAAGVTSVALANSAGLGLRVTRNPSVNVSTSEVKKLSPEDRARFELVEYKGVSMASLVEAVGKEQAQSIVAAIPGDGPSDKWAHVTKRGHGKTRTILDEDTLRTRMEEAGLDPDEFVHVTSTSYRLRPGDDGAGLPEGVLVRSPYEVTVEK